MSDWATFALDDIATIRIGGTPPRDVDAYWAGESDPGFAWVSIADLNGRIVSETKELPLPSTILRRFGSEGRRRATLMPIGLANPIQVLLGYLSPI